MENSWGRAGTWKGDYIGHAVDQICPVSGLAVPLQCTSSKRVLKQVSSMEYVPNKLIAALA